MSFQPLLFGETRFERWLLFHRANPRIYQLFRMYAERAKAAGRERFGARPIWERIRWDVYVETKTDDGIKLNDHYPPYYARLLMLREPQFAGFFERRDSRFDVDDERLLREANEIDKQRGMVA
jgi:hypothetical protein